MPPTSVSTNFVIRDSGQPDEVAQDAEQHSLQQLPVETLVYLLGSRYCETDRFTQIAWSTFANTPKGWRLVQAICDYIHLSVAVMDESRQHYSASTLLSVALTGGWSAAGRFACSGGQVEPSLCHD
jgi:transglutaminase-like putative cysteine protease